MAGPGGIINLTSGNNTFPGAGDNNSGDETVNGLLGNDIIRGGAGRDTLNGGGGLDSLHDDESGSYFDDALNGDAGDDVLYSAGGRDTIDGGLGIDTLLLFHNYLGEAITFTMTSSAHLTTLVGDGTTVINVENIAIWGTAFNDSITTFTGNDGLGGGGGNDILNGGSGNDSLSDDDSFLASDAFSDDTLLGGAGDDSIRCYGGRDTIDGGAGIDRLYLDRRTLGQAITFTMTGFATPTTLVGDGTTVVNVEILSVSATNFNDSFTTLTGNDYLGGHDGDDTLNGGGGGDTLLGGLGDDTLDGGLGDDAMNGDLGADTLNGGDGDDAIFDEDRVVNIDGGNGDDQILIDSSPRSGSLIGGAGRDRLVIERFHHDADISGIAVSGFEVLEFSSRFAATLAQLDSFDTILTVLDPGFAHLNIAEIGGPQAADLSDELDSGGITRLYLYGSRDDDTITTGNGNDDINGQFGNDVLHGGDGNDRLSGHSGDDTLDGGAGNDHISYEYGRDTIDGGAGMEHVTLDGEVLGRVLHIAMTLIVANTALLATLVENGTTVVNVEAFTVTWGEFNDSITTAAGVDSLYGNGGSDRLAGGDGNDWIDGGDGSDTIDWSGAGAAINFVLAANGSGIGPILPGIGQDTFTGIESVIGGALGDTITGNAGANSLAGLGGGDALAGGSGNDTLDGGAGDDTLNGDAGSDTVSYASSPLAVTVSLAIAGAQNTGAGLDSLIGIENLTGGGGGDRLAGTAGNNRLDGGAGSDTADYSAALGGGVTVHLGIAAAQAVGAGQGLDTLLRIESVIGSAAADRLTGNAGVNTLAGLAGNDMLNGLGGLNTLIGGLGDDRYFSQNAADTISENLNEGADILFSSVSRALGANLEDLYLYGAAAIGTGNAWANRLFGNASAIALTLDGGEGDDTLYGSQQADTLIGGLGDDKLAGNGGANQMQGGGGGDMYYSRSAADVVTEGFNQGDDILFSTVNIVALAANVERLFIYGGANSGTGNGLANTLHGNVSPAAVTLDGAAGNDKIIGSSQNDVLIGGAGNDVLNGFGGNDRFRFAAAGSGADNIVGFDANPAGGQDLIDVSGRGFTAASIGGAIVIAASGAHTLITIGADTILLFGVGVANVGAGDFMF